MYSRSFSFSTNRGLASRELAIVGLPVYNEARRLVENIVEGVAISIRYVNYCHVDISSICVYLKDGMP